MTIRELLYFIGEIKDIDLDAEIKGAYDGDWYDMQTPAYDNGEKVLIVDLDY